MTGAMTKQSDDIYGDNLDELGNNWKKQGPIKVPQKSLNRKNPKKKK